MIIFKGVEFDPIKLFTHLRSQIVTSRKNSLRFQNETIENDRGWFEIGQ